jgi:hypothetical protein
MLEDEFFLEEIDLDVEWGRPLREPNNVGGKLKVPCDDRAQGFWEGVPMIRF